MEIEFDEAHRAVIISDEGMLSGELFGRWLRELVVEPDFELDLHQIFDLSRMRGLPATLEELEKFLLVASGFNRGTGRIALVAPAGFAAGFGPEIAAAAEAALKRPLGVFATREEALGWVVSRDL